MRLSRALCSLVIMAALMGLFADARDEEPIWPAMLVTGVLGWLMFDYEVRKARMTRED